MTRIAEIADRLRRLAKRREDEGIYTDAALCEEAASLLTHAQLANFEQAVAWQQYGKRTGWTNVDPDFAQTLAAGGERVRPLFTRPAPASPVTEEMVRAAYDEWIADVRELEPTWEQLPQSHKDRLRRSLEAASLASCRQVEGE